MGGSGNEIIIFGIMGAIQKLSMELAELASIKKLDKRRTEVH